MTKAELQELVDRLPDQTVDGAALLLEEISVDPEQAGFWTREWREKEAEADADIAAGRGCQRRSKTGPLLPVEKWTTPGSQRR